MRFDNNYLGRTFLAMASQESIIDPDDLVHLQVSLNEGPPVPFFVLSDIRSRDDDEEVVIETTRMNVRLRTSGPGAASPDHDSSTDYPGLNPDPS